MCVFFYIVHCNISIYLLYLTDALNNYDGGVRSVTGPNATAGIFATYPKPYVSIGGAIGDSVRLTVCITIFIIINLLRNCLILISKKQSPL